MPAVLPAAALPLAVPVADTASDHASGDNATCDDTAGYHSTSHDTARNYSTGDYRASDDATCNHGAADHTTGCGHDNPGAGGDTGRAAATEDRPADRFARRGWCGADRGGGGARRPATQGSEDLKTRRVPSPTPAKADKARHHEQEEG